MHSFGRRKVEQDPRYQRKALKMKEILIGENEN